MHKTKEMVEKFERMEEKLCSRFEDYLCNMDCADTQECGEVVDMIKDLAEAKEKCWKGMYYYKVCEAMDEEEKEGYNDRMGYDNWRYSSGRFAPKGRGHRAGYMPYPNPPMNPNNIYQDDLSWGVKGRMGYDGDDMGGGSQQGGNTGANGRMGYDRPKSKYGKAYDEYVDARRFYTETGKEEDKARMDEKAKEHMASTVESIRDIWNSADPQLQYETKEKLTELLRELK